MNSKTLPYLVLRCQQPGMQPIVIPDGIRGLWMRHSSPDTLELIAGREGGDDELTFKVGDVITPETIKHISDFLQRLAFAFASDCASGSDNPVQELMHLRKFMAEMWEDCCRMEKMLQDAGLLPKEKSNEQ